MLLAELTVAVLLQQLLLLEVRNIARIDDHVGLEVEDPLQLTEADVEEVIGLRHQRRILVILDGDRAAVHLGFRILAGPGALGDRDGAELPAGGAVDRHVARRHPGMMAHRAQVAERLAPVAGLLGMRHPAMALLARFLRLRPVRHGPHDADVVGNTAVKK